MSLRKKFRQATRPYRHALVERLVRAVISAFGLLPVGLNVQIGACLGWLAGWVAVGQVRLMAEHLALAYGEELSAQDRQRIAREVLVNLGRSAFEVISYRRITPQTVREYVEVVGEDSFREAMAAGKGALLLGPHLGNWELAGAFFPLTGWQFNVIARENANRGLAAVIDQIRASWGMRILHRSPVASAKAALKILREGELLALLIDQDIAEVDSVFVPFFGRPTATPSGPAMLALKTGAPVFLCFIERIAPTRHRLSIEGPIPVPSSGDRQADVQTWTAQVSLRIEQEIRRRPADWVWMHRRWRRQPSPVVQEVGV